MGLTDHPTTDVSVAHVDGIGGIDLTPQNHFKIIFYSRGLRDGRNEIRYPFNVEMNFNHEYWHLRKNDPADRTDADRFGVIRRRASPSSTSNSVLATASTTRTR